MSSWPVRSLSGSFWASVRAQTDGEPAAAGPVAEVVDVVAGAVVVVESVDAGPLLAGMETDDVGAAVGEPVQAPSPSTTAMPAPTAAARAAPEPTAATRRERAAYGRGVAGTLER